MRYTERERDWKGGMRYRQRERERERLEGGNEIH